MAKQVLQYWSQVGPVWKLFEENGFLVTQNLELSGLGTYIYPGANASNKYTHCLEIYLDVN